MNERDTMFLRYMRRGDPTWESQFFDDLWQAFPSGQCDCCEGHLFIHCGDPCHVGFEVHGRVCNGCKVDRVHSLLRYENKMLVDGHRTLIASEFDEGGFVCYVVLTEQSALLHTFGSHVELTAAMPGADVDVYQRRGDLYDDHN